MAKKNINQKFVDSIIGVAGNTEIRDRYVAGLGIILRKTCRHTWTYRRALNGKMKKLTLGPVSEHTVEEARLWAVEQSRSFDMGIDPAAEKNDNAERQRFLNERTCDWLFNKYMENEGNSRKTANQKWSMYNNDISPKIGKRSYFDISHNDLANIIYDKKEKTPPMANRIFSLIQRWFNWSSREGLHISNLLINPAANLTKASREIPRSRTFNDTQISIFLYVLNQISSRFCDPLLVSIHTGAREGEVFGMKWSELDLTKGDWLIPSCRTKNGIELLIPLPPVIVSILRNIEQKRTIKSDLVWPSKVSKDRTMSGFSKITSSLNDATSAEAIKRGVVMDKWRIHDLRRSVITGMSGLLDENDRPLIPPHVIERIVNHKLPGQQFVYNRHHYYAEKKSALRIWANHLSSLIAK